MNALKLRHEVYKWNYFEIIWNMYIIMQEQKYYEKVH